MRTSLILVLVACGAPPAGPSPSASASAHPPPPVAATWTLTTSLSATSVEVVGDLDGDGFAEIAVGDAAQGLVEIFRGSPSGPLLPPILLDPPPSPSGVEDGFGRMVAGVGDIDGDGLPDLLVGADSGIGPGEYNGYGDHQGGVHLYAGDSLLTVRLLARIEATSVYTGVGRAGHPALGDIDGDGLADMIVGSQSGTPNSPRATTTLLTGRSGPWPSMLTPELLPYVNAIEAHTVVVVGDLDGNGTPDVAISTEDFNEQAPQAQWPLQLRWGVPGGLQPAYIPTTGPSGASTGVLIAGGDVTGDGLPDLLVARPDVPDVSNVLQTWEGRLLADPVHTKDLQLPVIEEGFIVPDLDQDGFDDVLAVVAGQAEVLFGGGASGLVREPVLLGSARATGHMGDVDGDARDDFVFADDGVVRVWSGLELTLDTDGDGRSDALDCEPTVPLGPEVPYDEIDNDCLDGDLDDVDGDGFASTQVHLGTDCDDTDPSVSPGADEIFDDGFDQDCDPTNELDADGDGVDAATQGGTDCDDTRSDIFPGAPERAYDGRDQDCDGADLVDRDLDGVPAPVDCDDTDPTVAPGLPDPPWDGTDADCDGRDGLTLAVGDTFLGGPVFLQIVGAPPRTRTGLAWAAAPGAGPCPAGLGACLDLQPEGTVMLGLTDATGTLRTSWTPPPGWTGGVLQAGALGAGTTPLVSVTLQPRPACSLQPRTVHDLRAPGSEIGAMVDLGDVDGDGVRDLALFDPQDGAAPARVRVLDGIGGQELARVETLGLVGDRMAAGVRFVPDLDGDGTDELFVFDRGPYVDNRRDDRADYPEGTGWLFYGPLGGPLRLDQADTFFTSLNGSCMPYLAPLVRAPDLDRDGVHEVAVPVVWSVSPTNSSADAAIQVFSPTRGAHVDGRSGTRWGTGIMTRFVSSFGACLWGTPDLTGNQIDDVLVSGRPDQNLQVYQPSLSGTYEPEFLPSRLLGDARPMFHIQTLPDLDADGTPEMLVEAVDDGPETRVLALTTATPLFRGLAPGLQWTAPPDAANLAARIADFDGDGRLDLLAATETALYLVRGHLIGREGPLASVADLTWPLPPGTGVPSLWLAEPDPLGRTPVWVGLPGLSSPGHIGRVHFEGCTMP